MSKYNFSFKEESPVKSLTSRWEKVSSDHRHLTRRDAVVKNEQIIKEQNEELKSLTESSRLKMKETINLKALAQMILD